MSDFKHFFLKIILDFISRLALQREKEMERYVCENRHLKEKWKDAIEDFTKTFEQEICKLRDSNTSLEAENRELRTRMSLQ